MTERIHRLKCWTEPFEAMLSGDKTFELRRNDRDFRVGDILHQQEWNPGTDYTGREIYQTVRYILCGGFGLPEGYCIMSVVPSMDTGVEKENITVGMVTAYECGMEDGERRVLEDLLHYINPGSPAGKVVTGKLENSRLKRKSITSQTSQVDIIRGKNNENNKQ